MARIVIVMLLLSLGGTSYAADEKECESHSEADATLCTYEPNTIGYTKDDDDLAFMDFKLSVRYQLFPDWMTRGLNYLKSDVGYNSATYFAFTGRFGQYIGNRDSSPVVGKRFNPKLFFRYWYDGKHEEYVDLAYAHESNGQFINKEAQYQAARSTAEQPEYANDHLSRGWDYFELVWKKIACEDEHRALSAYLTLKQFLPWGVLQKEPEEYNSWEGNPEGKPRDQVNGVAGMLKCVMKGQRLIFKDLKLAVSLETGYRKMFNNNTVRFEAGTKVLQLPLTLWAQTGYGSDLAQYYKDVNSYGIEVDIGSF